MSDLPPTDKEIEVYEAIEADHEYETLDKYDQTYENVKTPSPKVEIVKLQQSLASAGDNEFTQCPAYVPIATTSIHGNTNKPMDTPSVHPTPAQDNY